MSARANGYEPERQDWAEENGLYILTIIYRDTGRIPESPAAPALGATQSGRPVSWPGLVLLGAGVLAVVGSFLPWITATAAFVGTLSRNGLDGGGDGLFTIVLGFVLGLLGIAMLAGSGRTGAARVGALLASLGLGYIAIVDIGSVNERIAEIDSSVVASLGMGLYAIALAAAMGIVGALLPGRQVK
jgi:hypothetical protein